MKITPAAEKLQGRSHWTRTQLLKAKPREQAIIDGLSRLGRDLTPHERATLFLALRTIREISKHMTKRRGALIRKGDRHV